MGERAPAPAPRARAGTGPWIVVAGAVLAYGAAVAGGFVYDDHHSVRQNPALAELANVPRFFVDVDAFSAIQNRMYRPVLLATFAIDRAVGAGAAWAFKLTNVLLHAVTAVLLRELARRLGVRGVAATAGALAFAVHPLASEAVNMVSARSELLCLFGVLAALHCHLWAREGRRGAWLGTVAGTVVACGSKETGAVLPVLLVFAEVSSPGGGLRAWKPALRRALPAAGVVIAYLVARKVLLGTATVRVADLAHGADPFTGHGRDLVTQLATMAAALPGVLWQVVWPAGLTLDPPVRFHQDPFVAPVVGGALLLAVVTAAGLAAGPRRPTVAFGTLFAWLIAAPWVIVPLNVPLAEHRLYGPLAGLALVLAGLWPRSRGAAYERALVAAGAAVAVAFAAVAAERSLCYRDEAELWRRAIARAPDSYRARYGLGVCLMREGDLEAARDRMLEALGRYPGYVSARKNVAEIELQLGDRGDPARALEESAWLLERQPDNPFYRLLSSRALAALAARTGDEEMFDAAVERALSVLEIAEPKGLVYRTAAHARRLQGRPEEALALLDAGIARGLDHPEVLYDRHAVLLDLGRRGEAEADLVQALQRALRQRKGAGGSPANGDLVPALLAALQRLRAAAPR